MSESKSMNFTTGPVFGPLVRFAIPVLGALFLQALYGAIDLLIVGQFATTADVSGVATGSMLLHSLSFVVIGLSMGITILSAQKIGEGNSHQAGAVVGTGITLFTIIGIVWSVFMMLAATSLTRIMQAPPEAFDQTRAYIFICGAGGIFITAFNLVGSIFRGIGDSKMPLITVAISAAVNVVLDLLFVVVFKMGAAGAAWATIIAQALSVVTSLFIIKTRKLPFTITREDFKMQGPIVLNIFKLGTPLALNDLLVGISFLVIMAIINTLGVEKSAGIGIAERVCGFVMLFPSAFSQSVSTFVAQNYGANKMDRANRSLAYGIGTSLCVGFFVGSVTFFFGNYLSAIFSHDAAVIVYAHEYLKAYAIDTLLTSFLFCFIGYFNGIGMTFFTMIQGLIGAFAVRIPVSFAVVHLVKDPTLFQIGLATPASSLVQITLCGIVFFAVRRKMKRNGELPHDKK